jgi:hypothetical protein
MKNCPTVRIGSFERNGTVPVWTRKKLAREYRFKDELQFVKWAIIAGNDFTSHFALEDFGLPKKYCQLSKEELFYLFHSNLVEWDPLAITTKENCRQAIAYSFHFYQLQGLKPYMLEQYKTTNQLEELEDIEFGLRLSKAMKTDFQEWFSHSIDTKNTVVSMNPVGVILSFLESCIVNNVNSFQEGNMIKIEHIQSLAEMVQLIELSNWMVEDREIKLNYEDQKVGNIYQLLLREAHKLFERYDMYPENEVGFHVGLSYRL